MRILLSCLQDLKPHAIPAYGFWHRYFVQGLIEAGHAVVEAPNVDWAEGLTNSGNPELQEWRARTWEKFEQFVRQEHKKNPIHLFVSYFYPKQVEVAVVHKLQTLGIPCVNFFCDNVRDFTAIPAEFRSFDLHWVPEFEALPIYQKASLPYVHAAMPCWISPELRNTPKAETEPCTFIGSADDLRRELVGSALKHGADFVVRGQGWLDAVGSAKSQYHTKSMVGLFYNQIDLVRNHGLSGLLRKIETRLRPLQLPHIPRARIKPMPSDSDYVRITREATITIGVSRVATANRSMRRPLCYSRLRDIEAPMLGACYLTEWSPGLGQMYELGNEIETYRTPEELSSKLGQLQQDHVRRTAMRERAQRRALAEHTIAHSIARIAAYLGLKQ